MPRGANGSRQTGSGAVPAGADAVVVGGGTIGGWGAYFLRRAGAGRVVLIERDTLGCGASSRAAGMVRAQGGTPAAVRLGMWSRDFYLRQRAEIGVDSGFVTQGYFLPAFDEAEVERARARLAMQQALGLEVHWLDPDDADRRNPTMTRGTHLGGSFAPGDGFLDPPRNVAAYTVALARAGVEVHERVALTGVRLRAGRVIGVDTTNGPIDTDSVVLTGGPGLADVAALAGVRVPTGGVRHQVAVTEPHPIFDSERFPMVFDVGHGLYWRPHEGGVLFGMSNPGEVPGVARAIDWAYLERMRSRLEELVPAVRGLELRTVWAATIDYTPDHLPVIGPALGRDGPVAGITVASAGGHGMMWGPAVSSAVADVALTGTTDVVDISELGLDRFDAEGRSRLDPDPLALPFPERTTAP